jgi:hypothetical protein
MEIVHILIPTTEERRERLSKCVASIHENAGFPHIISTYENYREGFVKPCYLLLKDLKEDTLVWCIGDDTILAEKDTLKRLVDAYRACYPNNDGVVQPNDGIQGGNIITMPLCSAKTMIEKGIHLDFFLNFCDNIFTEIMRKENKYTYLPDINVDHQHFSQRKSPLDETYAYANTQYDKDRETYFIIKKKLNL